MILSTPSPFPHGDSAGGARRHLAQDRRRILWATAKNRPCTGHDVDSEQQSRRVLRRTTAPTLKFRRIAPQVACAKSVPFRSSARKRYDCVALRADVTTASSPLMACDSVFAIGYCSDDAHV